ncbi:hypothetical protein ABXS71_16795 [Bacillus infantis]
MLKKRESTVGSTVDYKMTNDYFVMALGDTTITMTKQGIELKKK